MHREDILTLEKASSPTQTCGSDLTIKTLVKELQGDWVGSLILLILALLPFYRLGIGEIQPWDEALYAIRAQACLKFGAWLDQTAYAVGHLYSGTHPPLGVWFIACSKFLFGSSTFALRLPIAIAASLSVITLYTTLRRLTPHRAALIGAVLYGTADLFVLYSHRAQLEMFVLAFSIASLYCYVASIQGKRDGLLVVAGVLFGLALLSKFLIALCIVPLVFLIPWSRGGKIYDRRAILFVVYGLLVCLPWFILMNVRHPEYFQHVSDSLSTLRAGTYSHSSASWWYYLNRLMIAAPLLPIAVAAQWTSRDRRSGVAGIWLFSVFIALQVVGTKMPHFALLLILPASLWVALSFEDFLISPKRIRFAAAILSALLIAWSASEQARLALTGRLSTASIVFPHGLLVLIMAFLVVALAIMKRNRYQNFALLCLVSVAFVRLYDESQSVFTDGAGRVASDLSYARKTNLIVVHKDVANEQYAPQLAYYTDGWNLDWHPNKGSQTVTWEAAVLTDWHPSPGDAIVIPRFRDRFSSGSNPDSVMLRSLDLKFRQVYAHRDSLRSYTVYY